jgi:hypothetical protein
MLRNKSQIKQVRRLFEDVLSTDVYSVCGKKTITGEVQGCERQRSGMFDSGLNFTVPSLMVLSENNETTQSGQIDSTQKSMPRPPGIPNLSAECWDA